MNEKNIFDARVKMAYFDAGTEPSLREMIRHYYQQAFSIEESKEMSDKFIELLQSEVK